MTAGKIYRAVGLMSGTVLDGEIDVALIETDGHQLVRALDFYTHPYAGDVRDKVRACFGKRTPDAATATAEKLVTDLHIDAVLSSGYNAEIIGFHGQTITHAPADQFTWQLGDSARLARETGIDVVGDLRQADIQAGGQGAPLLPLYHAARLADHPRPVAILNLGGVANITFIDDEQIIAFDTGPANALMDDYMRIHYRQSFDNHGAIAAQGTVQQDILRTFLQDPFLAQTGPKSLDRNHWDLSWVDSLAPEDAMATLLALSTGSI
ncbi:MAG: anhydro-N-acetylmuramic acid kinase, partial [Gammaproteobacteria bacterium]